MTDRVLRYPDVSKAIGLSARTIRDMVRDGSFPKPFILNPTRPRAVGWRETTVMGWIDEREAA